MDGPSDPRRQAWPLPAARVVYILQQACESLAEAHERGLVHRDIKPGNIQVCRMGQYFDDVKVLDFGLVKTQEEAGGPELGLTAANAVTGTPAYLSPESALGGPVDQRTDIYALGVRGVLDADLGRDVFTGDSPIHIMARHVNTPPVPPSRHSAFNTSPTSMSLSSNASARSRRSGPGVRVSCATG